MTHYCQATFVKSENVSSHRLNSKNNGAVLLLRPHFDIETVSPRLLLQMVRMDMDCCKTKKHYHG